MSCFLFVCLFLSPLAEGLVVSVFFFFVFVLLVVTRKLLKSDSQRKESERIRRMGAMMPFIQNKHTCFVTTQLPKNSMVSARSKQDELK